MAKKFEKKLLSSAMALAIVSGVGFGSTANAIQVTEVGQVLLAPVYTTVDGQVTKFAVYNTLDNHAVKAKVVIRSFAHSIELRDFVCYLTPADVCRFELRQINGRVYLTSTDDSVRSGVGDKFANEVPLQIGLDTTEMMLVDRNDSDALGHVEIIGAYSLPAGQSEPGKPTIQRTMLKRDLAKYFDTVPRFLGAGSISVSNNPDTVQLSADVTIQDSKGGRMDYKVPALAVSTPANVTYRLPGNVPLAFDGRVIAASNYDADPTARSNIGQRMGINGTDNLYEIEYALASTSVSGIYEFGGVYNDDTNIIVTFPTKYRHRGTAFCEGTGVVGSNYSWPFNFPGTVNFKFADYDNEENRLSQYFSPQPEYLLYAEVNLFNPVVIGRGGWSFASGWFDMVFEQACAPVTGAAYTGMPLLALVNRTSSADNSLIPSATK